MGTQATLAIVQNGQVIRKIVAGCEGYNMTKLKRALETKLELDPRKLVSLCSDLSIGCANCLLIQISAEQAFTPLEEEMAVPNALYSRTFSDPKFNPRWENGTAPYSLIVEAPVAERKSS